MPVNEKIPDTLAKIFEEYEFFKIPNYQRPYSWEETQLKQFIEDLKEFSTRKNLGAGNYYFGHFLFEKKHDGRYSILDGQQRLTTVIIFMYVCNLFLKDDQLRDKYIIKSGKYRLEVLDGDNDFFKKLLPIESRNIFSNAERVERKSQQNLYFAYDFFKGNIEKFSEEEIKSFIKTIETSVVSVAFVESREIANQVFIFHNSRGKSLTKIDKLKSFLIKEIYRNKTKDVANDISSLDQIYSSIFASVYRSNGKHFFRDEDTILFYFFVINMNHSYKKVLEIEDIESDFRENKKYTDIFSSIENIISFSKKLLEFYENFAQLIEDAQTDNKYANILCLNGSASTYCILIALRNYFSNRDFTEEQLNKIYKYIEIIYFRMKYADFRISANDFPWLIGKILKEELTAKDALGLFENWSNNSFRGSTNRLLNIFNSLFKDKEEFNFYGAKHNATWFLLWKYENYLRLDNDKRASLITYKQYAEKKGNFSTIEHIYPQTDKNIDNQLNDKNRYLINDIGNLLPMKDHQNSSYSNKSPEDKYDSAKTYWVDLIINNQLQKEIGELVKNNHKWREEQIKVRGEKIKDFALKYFQIEYKNIL